MRLGKLGWILVVAGVVMAGCATDRDIDEGNDAGIDGGSDTGVDAGTDAGSDGGIDARCVRNADCPPPLRCQTATGQCVPRESPTRCADSAECASWELCHPTAEVCVRTCESGADCPDSAKTCAPLGGTGPNAHIKICQCSADALCNNGQSASTLVCSDLDNVCTPRCTAHSECGTGRLCETETGQCIEEDTSGTHCTGEGQSTCHYGTHSCQMGTCSWLPAPTCLNYENFPNKDELGTTGQIIYAARTVSFATDTVACAPARPMRVKIALSAYSSTPFPSTRGDLNGLFYVMTEGTRTPGNVSSGADYTVLGGDRQRAEIVVSLCVSEATTSVSAGFYFTGGNFLCYRANR